MGNNRLSTRLQAVRDNMIMLAKEDGEHTDDIARILGMSTNRVQFIVKGEYLKKFTPRK